MTESSLSYFSGKLGALLAFGFISTLIMGGYLIVLIVTGTDYISMDIKEYNSAKDDCESLKQYLLDNYGSFKYEEAKEHYRVLCE